MLLFNVTKCFFFFWKCLRWTHSTYNFKETYVITGRLLAELKYKLEDSVEAGATQYQSAAVDGPVYDGESSSAVSNFYLLCFPKINVSSEEVENCLVFLRSEVFLYTVKPG
jgi:hypothetical protein